MIFSPYNPFPPEHGAHARIVQQIRGLQEAGQVFLASTRYSSDKPWPERSRSLAGEQGVAQVLLFEDSFVGLCDRLLRVPMRVLVSISKRLGRAAQAKEARRRLHVRLVNLWFRRLVARLGIDVVVINYTKWGGLVRGLDRRVVTVLELHDLAPINQYLATEIAMELITRGGVSELKKGYRQFGYVTRADSLPTAVRRALDQEIAAMAIFDLVVSISDSETALVREGNPNLVLETIYPEFTSVSGSVASPSDRPGDYALLPTGPSLFNTYSLLRYFDAVEPLIEYPEGARVEITGRIARGHDYRLPARYAYQGLVEDYLGKLRGSRFVIAPTLVGTGQQMKLFEALSVGVPVVCYRAAVPEFLRGTGMGIIAVADDREFARAVSRLWQDDAYCLRMRQGAATFSTRVAHGPGYRDLAAHHFATRAD